MIVVFNPQFFSKSTERFVHGVDSLLEILWRSWTDLLDALGIDCTFSSTFTNTHTHTQYLVRLSTNSYRQFGLKLAALQINNTYN